jgi:hypothetical protein
VLVHLVTGPRVHVQVLLDAATFVVADCVEGVGAEQLVEF